MNNLQSYIDEEGNRYAFGGDYGFTDTDYTKEILFWGRWKSQWEYVLLR